MGEFMAILKRIPALKAKLLVMHSFRFGLVWPFAQIR